MIPITLTLHYLSSSCHISKLESISERLESFGSLRTVLYTEVDTLANFRVQKFILTFFFARVLSQKVDQLIKIFIIFKLFAVAIEREGKRKLLFLSHHQIAPCPLPQSTVFTRSIVQMLDGWSCAVDYCISLLFCRFSFQLYVNWIFTTG